MSEAPVRVANAETALQSYLDHLLLEATSEGPAVEPHPTAADALAPPVAANEMPEPAPSAVEGPSPVPGQAALEGQTPGWGQKPFQVLVCRVGPLRVAVPLIKLREVVAFTNVGAVLPHAPHWVLGMLRHRDRQVHVVDTARLILPRQDSDPESAQEEPIRHLLLVGDGGWGLGCQEIGEVMVVQPEQVRWRSAMGKRPWLAGTVVEQLCALIDVDVLPTLLEAGRSLAWEKKTS